MIPGDIAMTSSEDIPEELVGAFFKKVCDKLSEIPIEKLYEDSL